MAVALAMAGCAGGSPFETRMEYAARLAQEGGWKPLRISSGRFVLHGFEKAGAASVDTISIYIEGDGFSWRDRHTPSSDPTPWDPTALKLALKDPAPRIVYLARPCQYVDGEDRRGCEPAFWMGRRYSPPVIEAMDAAITRTKAAAGARSVRLLGYSGGGVVAALLAARREDVRSLVTVAAPLDTDSWTRYHGVSPLYGSLNPKDFVSRLNRLPQRHFVGGRDRVVPRQVAESYIRSQPRGGLAKFVTVAGFSHHCCWIKAWRRLLRDQAPNLPLEIPVSR